MTKKDYEMIEKAISKSHASAWRSAKDGSFEFVIDSIMLLIVTNFCMVLSNENPGFDQKKFEQACRRQGP